MWTSDAELFALMRERLFTAVVGDILDELGLLHQFLPPAMRPLDENMIVAGRAMPVLEADLPEGRSPAKPFGLLMEALDDLKPDEVYIAGGSIACSYAMWGELMSTRARVLGAAGAVLNGPSRDTRAILEMKFPVFSTGRYAQDQKARGEVLDFRIAIDIEAVHVEPGDIVFGDIDGVLIVPRAVEREVLTRALEKAAKENTVRTAILNGMSTVDAFAKHSVM
ncbi:MAG: RraA family protein [Bryobacteraceae bacterium]|jgi:regulator of RNase E activity RraA